MCCLGPRSRVLPRAVITPTRAPQTPLKAVSEGRGEKEQSASGDRSALALPPGCSSLSAPTSLLFLSCRRAALPGRRQRVWPALHLVTVRSQDPINPPWAPGSRPPSRAAVVLDPALHTLHQHSAPLHTRPPLLRAQRLCSACMGGSCRSVGHPSSAREPYPPFPPGVRT